VRVFGGFELRASKPLRKMAVGAQCPHLCAAMDMTTLTVPAADLKSFWGASRVRFEPHGPRA